MRYAYDLIKEWKSIKSTFYKKALSEILLIIDEYFDEIRDNKKMKEEDFSFINQMVLEIESIAENVYASFQKLSIKEKSKVNALKSTIEMLTSRIQSQIKKLENNTGIIQVFSVQYP